MPIKKFISCVRILGTKCQIKQYINVVSCVWSSHSQPISLAFVCSVAAEFWKTLLTPLALLSCKFQFYLSRSSGRSGSRSQHRNRSRSRWRSSKQTSFLTPQGYMFLLLLSGGRMWGGELKNIPSTVYEHFALILKLQKISYKCWHTFIVTFTVICKYCSV